MAQTFMKDPQAVLDFTFQWSSWLADAETITAATMTVDGATLDRTDTTTSTVTAWISGGTADTNGTVTCQVTTSDGRTDNRTIRLSIRER